MIDRSARSRGQQRARRTLAICGVLASTWLFLGCIVWEELALKPVETTGDMEALSRFEGRWFDENLEIFLVIGRDGGVEVLVPTVHEPLEAHFDRESIRIRIDVGQAEQNLRFVPIGDQELALVPAPGPTSADSAWVVERLTAQQYLLAKAERWARAGYDEVIYWLAAVI